MKSVVFYHKRLRQGNPHEPIAAVIASKTAR